MHETDTLLTSQDNSTLKPGAVTVREQRGSALMSGVWLDRELNAKMGRPRSSHAYSTTVPTGNPAQAPKLPTVDSIPVLWPYMRMYMLDIHASCTI